MVFVLGKEQAFVVEKRSILSITSQLLFIWRARYIIFIIYRFFSKIPYYICIYNIFFYEFIYYIGVLLILSFKIYNMVLIVIKSKSKAIWQRLTLYIPSLIHSILVGLKLQLAVSLSSLSLPPLCLNISLTPSLLAHSSLSLSLRFHVHADRFYASST